MTSAPTRGKCHVKTETHRGEGYVTLEAVSESDAAVSQGTWIDSHHWKLGKGKEGFQPETEGPWACQHLDFRLSPQTMRG